MFDKTPNSLAQGAVPGTALSPLNNGERSNMQYIWEIFDPDKHPIEDLHRYIVPKEGTLVFDVPAGIIYEAVHVDYQATLKTTLRPWRITNVDEGATSEQDWIFGLRGGPGLGEALLAIDYSVRPNVARVDSTIMRPGASYAKLFLGNDPSENGRIISAQYSSSLTLLNNRVPCKLAEIVDRTNQTIMTTGPFSVTENAEGLPNGTRCLLVFYDVGGDFIPPVQPVMVQHTAYMRDHQIGIRYIEEIRLVSPWFTNTSDPERLMVPINVNLLSVELRAVIHYNDGTDSGELPVNGTRFTLRGLNEHRPTFPGQTSGLVLTLRLAGDEQLVLADPGTPNHKSREYTIEAGAVKGAYSPRIFTYPQWDSAIRGWTLKHWLFDLDRKVRIDVTDLVTLNSLSPPWRPTAYGVEQAMIFNLNLRDVSPTYESFIFKQYTQITLLKDVLTEGKRWQVAFTSGKPAYGGKNLVVVNDQANTTFDISQGHTTLNDWLNDLYWSISPAFSAFSGEDKAPTPTHFDLMDDTGRKWRFPVESFNVLDNPVNIPFTPGYTYYLSWVNKASSGVELQLGLSAVTAVLKTV